MERGAAGGVARPVSRRQSHAYGVYPEQGLSCAQGGPSHRHLRAAAYHGGEALPLRPYLLQEYFLAAYLARALNEGKVERWDLPREFRRRRWTSFGQLLALESGNLAPLRSMEGRSWEARHSSPAVLAFDYWLRALEEGQPLLLPRACK